MAAEVEVDPASFRDPAGFVFERDGMLLRQVNASYASEYDTLMASGLHAELVAEGLLLDHDEAGAECATEHGTAHRVIAPTRLPFVSYPNEWCHAQLAAAALALLRVQRIALRFGMTLKDAPARNIQFVRGRAVLIDTLSFAHYGEGEPWIAYRQFCEHFLVPLLLSHHLDERLLQSLGSAMRGVPLEVGLALLPPWRRVRHGAWLHLTLHGAFSARASAATGGAPSGVGRAAMLGLVDSLERAVTALRPRAPRRSHWSTYYDDNAYSAGAFADKRDVVERALHEKRPRSVWDLGANTGLFSRAAVAAGATTIAFEADPRCVSACFAGVAGDGLDLLPLVVDLAAPPTAAGWANTETRALHERGPADVVLALALVHHLVLAGNVPLPRVAEYLARLGRSVVVEFVPPDDVQAQRLASQRTGGHAYDRPTFEASFASHFELRAWRPLAESGRAIAIYDRRGAA